METCNWREWALWLLLPLTIVILAASGCDRGPASVELDVTEYEQSCETDDDCILVPGGEQCGPCPACADDPITVSAEPKFRDAIKKVKCRTTEPAAQCEPCPAREPYCDEGVCKSREPEEEEDDDSP